MNHNHQSTTRMAISATLHCLTGCAIGEILGLVIGTALAWNTVSTTILAVVLAFVFGFSLSALPLRTGGVGFLAALSVVAAADTLSITTMEIVDNSVMIFIPGALHAGLTDLLFWGSMGLSLVAAFIVAVPVNRYLLSKGKGHALLMQHHDH
jgi:hypothetical protein